MSLLRLQGLVFCCGAILLAAMAASLGQISSQIELLVIASLILVLGVPHGALDTIFARQIYGIDSLRGWICFGSIYLLLSALVVGIWLLQPAIFLLAFLFISAFHFSGDPVEGTAWPTRALYGGAVVILPAALHAVETARLFSLLAGESAADLVMPWLGLLSWPWLLGLILAAIQRSRTDWLTALELFSVATLSVLAPPLLSFTLFFCTMHSARHILRTINYSAQSSRLFVLAAALLPMFGVLIVSLIAWYFLQSTPLDARIVQIVFVGLAALTVPHMALVERVRLSGWVNPKKPPPVP
jgi:Brp/Blh family beta-carotene 15,15'-monooxygenase